MEHFVVESTISQPLGQEAESRTAKEIDASLEKSGGRWLRSYYSPDHRRVICEFLAVGEEALQKAYVGAGVPFDVIWRAEVFASESAPETA